VIVETKRTFCLGTRVPWFWDAPCGTKVRVVLCRGYEELKPRQWTIYFVAEDVKKCPARP